MKKSLVETLAACFVFTLAGVSNAGAAVIAHAFGSAENSAQTGRCSYDDVGTASAFGQCASTGGGFVSSSGSLATGTLTATAFGADATADTIYPPDVAPGSTAAAILKDEISFVGTAPEDDNADAVITVNVKGTVRAGAKPEAPGPSAQIRFNAFGDVDAPDIYVVAEDCPNFDEGPQCHIPFDGPDFEKTFDLVFYQVDLFRVRDIEIFATAHAIAGGFAEIAVTPLSFRLPQGLSFTSRSGVFLNPAVEPGELPEPDGLSLLAIGLMGAFWPRRSRSRM